LLSALAVTKQPLYGIMLYIEGVAEWYGAGLASRGSHPRLLCTNANSACHPFGVG